MVALTEQDKWIISQALKNYVHAAAYFSPDLAKQAEEIRKKLLK